MRKIALALILGVAGLTGSVAHADDSRFYVGVEGTQAHFSDDALSRENSTGVKVFGGYDLTRHVAIEGEVGTTDGYRVVPGDRASVTDAGVSLKLSQPLGHGLDVYGKVGMLYQDLSVDNQGSSNGFNPVFGAGVEYGLNKKVSLRLEDELTPRIAEVHDAYNSVNFGLAYRF